MELLGMIVVIIIVLILIYYFNKNFECFSNINPKQEIADIKKNYNLLIKETIDLNIKNIKNKIDVSIKNIEQSLVNNYDKYKLNNIYQNELIPLIDKPNINEFNIVINKIEFLVDYSFNSTYHDFSIIISNIKEDFKKLTELYGDVYLNKTINLAIVKNQIDNLTQTIYNSLLKITTHEDLNSSGIILILNTTLKRAFEINDITQINSLMYTFNEKIKKINNKLTSNIKSDDNKFQIKGVEMGLPATTFQPTTTISLHKDKEVINLIKDDFNNIYNSFDLINIIYKNNGDKKQIKELNNIIYKSIDNIINYNKTDIEYKNKITSIKIIVITPILSVELKESYKKNDNEVIKIKNKFYDGIVEIKNIIISNYSKTRDDNSRNVCLKEIIEAILNNNFPIKVNKLKGCNNSIFIAKNDLVIYPQMAVSKNNGKSWDFATDLLDYKQTGNKTGDYLYTYKLATTNGQKWSFIN
jgi:hypothetical protein